MKIDFVLPWVDGSDEAWLSEKSKYSPSQNNTYNAGLMRYRDWGTLKYVLRGIEKNCPWYNKIFIITMNQFPSWLNLDHPKVKIIDHKELFYNKEDLPTFNSSAIEMNLANLPMLSEHFIYLNDDLFILKSTPIERFFKNSLPVDFFSHGWLKRNYIFEKLRGMNTWAHSIKNNINLINKKIDLDKISNEMLFHSSYPLSIKLSNFLFKYVYKKVLWLEHYHQPMPYLKSSLCVVREIFENEMTICSHNKFRNNNDLTQYIYRYWNLTNGIFYPSKFSDHIYFKIKNKTDMNQCLKVIDDYRFVCANDSVDDTIDISEVEEIISLLQQKLSMLLPDKASFEI
ncbi:glycosyl transferase [Pasteurellaceae bacterium HPA106]|uniref:stealth family protein n=1 Tax=Spirabiliibacterium pneumoniae TaxID=221400 RepID=UPI001AADDB8A|nr:stealth family protein [Spirabiliibacterium pneumoniae]MBE2895832.1 glycosyl transferase [Spirabiliibacterium pneumoniae]